MVTLGVSYERGNGFYENNSELGVIFYTQAADAENSTKCNLIERIRTGYGSIPINTIFRGMNIHKSQLQYFGVN